MDYLSELFSTSAGFMPHGMCYLWTPELVWLHVVSDGLIVASYLVIPVTLLVVVRRRRDIPFNWMLLLFGTFIVACGLTHLMAMWNVWNADYWVSGLVKAITAIASLPTAIVLIYLLPRILSIPGRGELESANQQLAEANRELEQFAYAVSHDLRAPLRGVDGYGRALEERLGESLDEKGRHYLNRMRSGSQRMGELIDALLELSRLSREHVTHREVNLSELAREVADSQLAAYPERELRFMIEPAMVALCDPDLMRNVFSNLIGNAIKFTAGRSIAEIEIGSEQRDDGSTEYFVKDNGVGFDMRYVDKIFTVFQRLHTAQEFKGNGLGLASVEKIIHRHGGSVQAFSTEGEGATFRFTLGRARRMS